MGDFATKCDIVDFIIHFKGNLSLHGVTCSSHIKLLGQVSEFQFVTSH